MFYPKETTPQTVPAGEFTSDFFASYAELFDLSLLTPSDGEVPLSPQSQQLQLQLQQPLIQPSPEYIPATIFHDVPASMQQTLQQMKQEKPTVWSENLAESSLKSVLLEQLQAGPQYQYYSNTLLSPPQEQYAVFPPSPTPSIPDFQSLGASQHGFVTIKQEYLSLPPSPPDSNGAPSPVHCSEIKTEFDAEPSIDIDSLLGDAKKEPSLPTTITTIKQEFNILRDHLQDGCSFQLRKLPTSTKPVELESFIGGLTTRADIGSVFELALQDVQDGIQATCNTLGISADPRQWSAGQVQQWLDLAMTKYCLPPPANIGQLFPECGAGLAQLSMDEFVRRIPQGGDKLHGHLELWKQIYRSTSTAELPLPMVDGLVGPATGQDSSFDTESLNGDISDDDDEEMPLEGVLPTSTTPPTTSTPSTSGTTPPAKPRQGGSHIHLWQFLKELLGTPDQHQSAIRWIDRTKGVFKIEDSVRVARLWGRRKNRPAMNYDKLSRSIRQYYKKGIMQKTERSQRLVYQFCHPYSL